MTLNGSAQTRGAGESGEEDQTAKATSLPVDWEALARSFVHPLRISILEVLGLDGGRVLSPTELSQELQIPLGNTSYHVGELRKAGLLHLARRRPVRGTMENFYRLDR
jgi:DNA-binding transcriptional ArsR family regulator